MDRAEIVKRFYSNVLNEDAQQRYLNVCEEFAAMASYLERTLTDSREKSLALTKLEEAKFWASAAIARHQEVE